MELGLEPLVPTTSASAGLFSWSSSAPAPSPRPITSPSTRPALSRQAQDFLSPTTSPSRTGSGGLFERLDVNHDGVVSRAEFTYGLHSTPALNYGGSLSPFATAMRQANGLPPVSSTSSLFSSSMAVASSPRPVNTSNSSSSSGAFATAMHTASNPTSAAPEEVAETQSQAQTQASEIGVRVVDPDDSETEEDDSEEDTAVVSHHVVTDAPVDGHRHPVANAEEAREAHEADFINNDGDMTDDTSAAVASIETYLEKHQSVHERKQAAKNAEARRLKQQHMEESNAEAQELDPEEVSKDKEHFGALSDDTSLAMAKFQARSRKKSQGSPALM